MATKLTKDFHFARPPERVAEVLRSEAFNVESDESRDDVRSSVYRVIEEDDERVVFEMHSEEYKRTMTGALDRSGWSPAVVRSEWDARKGTLTWDYQGSGMSAKVKLGGVYHVLAEGDGTHLVHDVHIDVSVPLVGGRLAKLVAREFEKSVPGFEKLLREHLG